MNVPLHFLAYVLTPHYYSNTWLQSLDPKGEKRKKPHVDPDVSKVYLDVVDRLLRNSGEACIVRAQLSEFVCNTGVFGRPQAIQDKRTMSAVHWWNLHGAPAPELCGLAVKVLSQSINSSCAERAWSTYGFIHSVKRNYLNANRAESLVYVHYNHRLLTRYREDYERSYKNWDTYVEDNSMEIDMAEIEEREYALIFANGEAQPTRSIPVNLSNEVSIEKPSSSSRRGEISKRAKATN
ncbi:hypothetical protein Acr_10g0005890 [Actinidia rufa]|uniref:HAT C-terminal dimerisation domain-containing protein n=1 Tax=Actinidia rufa TaxID=165716 RepID=A0A7J0F921_9ERIC|nr:hypothetical protein Acr_10g0005890 [Actinidia rufa]